ncbi:amino acid adenylation domain-containing protein [Nocardia sp. NBC_01730]|uniref:non-ribosomal peptide synthetase n=1 Tax=Nocardia sp. NBC_01730 TaxID=2975998 RepID=UPI002E132080|nr:non-ribosomal peptide synthetase [Nocardia sp. NBC_01730]WSG61452.1 amino acid adenylation domain-containing protein [Nocardia sp. NBC_01730]
MSVGRAKKPVRVRPVRARQQTVNTLPRQLAAAVEADPDGTAVSHDGVALSYRELDEVSSRLARVLIARNVGPGDLVVVAIAPSIESVSAMWAVAKAGAGFVLVDATAPVERVAHLLVDATPAIGITTGTTLPDRESGAGRNLRSAIEWLVLDDPEFRRELVHWSAESVSYEDRLRPIRAEDVAYVAYTWSTTGTVDVVRVTQAEVATIGARRTMFPLPPSEPVSDFLSAMSAPSTFRRAPRDNDCSPGPHPGEEITLVEVFERVVAAYPDATAVKFGTETLTYRELAGHVNKLARKLVALGAGPETLVAVVLPRSLDLVVALLATVQAGGGYLPVDPAYPVDRIAYLLSDADPVCVVTTAGVPVLAEVPVLELDRIDLSDIDDSPVTDRDRRSPLRPGNVAYVIYTSGSTGRPKGMQIPHRNVVTLFANTRSLFAFDHRDVWTMFHSYAFDFSVWEMWGPLLHGGTLVVVDYLTSRSPEQFLELLRGEQVTVLNQTPSAFYQLADADRAASAATEHAPLSLRYIVFGGEALDFRRLGDWFDRGASTAKLVNMYGTTETTVHATHYRLSAATSSTIGAAIPGLRIWVLDQWLRPVPVGVKGELYIAGEQLGRGYLGRAGLTSGRFVADPFAADGTRLYRSGDLARWNSDGDLVYLGRADSQVKVRGFRIELGEIEAAVLAVESVHQAVVIVREDTPGDQRIVAYLVGRPDVAVVRDAVARVLPAHMVPTTFVVIDAIPLTAHGKLDRQALPAPVVATAVFRAPASLIEVTVADIFADVLGVERVGLDDDFFALGGNSLLATQAVARIKARIDAEFSARVLFEVSTVAEFSARISPLAGQGGRPPLVPRPRPARIPLSFAQQRMWVLNQFDTASAAYNIPFALRLTGTIDPDALQAALRDVVERHEPLRTIYPDSADGPFQQLLSPQTAPTLEPQPTTATDIPARIRTAVSVGFDLTSDVPMRASLFRLAPHEHVLVLVAHHIACDGMSLAPLARDFAAAYQARVAGAVPGWRRLPVQYADYALWQRELLGDEDDEQSLSSRQAAYWVRQLTGSPELLALPWDRPRPTTPSGRGGIVEFSVDANVTDGLRRLAAEHSATLFMVVHTALVAVLARLSGNTDITVGTQVAGRGDGALDELVGMFGNTLVLRAEVQPEESFSRLLARVRDTDLAAYDHADLSIDRVVELLRPGHSLSYAPLFQVLLMLQNFAQPRIELPGLGITQMVFDTEVAKVDLGVTLTENTDEDGKSILLGEIGYAQDLFDHATAESFARRYIAVLESVSRDEFTPVGDIAILSESESALLGASDNTAAPAPSGTLLDLFDAQVIRTPDATALVFGDDQWTYGEFDARVNRLARYLVAAGVGPESRVGIAVRRSMQQLVAVYAVLRAGGAYVPIDPDHPDARIAHVLTSSAPVLVLTVNGVELDSAPGCPVVLLDALDVTDMSAAPISDSDRSASLRPDNAAYVIYTSGSTGRPKGVVVSHRSVVNQMAWMRAHYELGPTDAVLHKTPFAFDASVWELFLPLQIGARLVVARHDGHLDPGYLIAQARTHRVSILEFVPSMLALLLADRAELPSSLRYLSIGGEQLSPTVLERLRHDIIVDNTYGPTEATVTSTVFRCSPHHLGAVPIGTPVPNTGAYVLDSRLHLVPPGVPGELYLSGVQLARAYLGDSPASAGRFVADPFGAIGTRMYRTGDLVRRLPDGNLEFLGRTDFQVKLRGLRIELGEIEATFAAHPSIDHAVVVVRHDQHVGDFLACYVVPTAGADIDTAELADHAARSLPAYMVPQHIIPMPSLPLTASGKLDRRALPAVEVQLSAPVYRAASTPAEQVISAAFAELLGAERVGLDDSFFDLGGNSLVGMRVLARINAALGTGLGVRELFEAPTVAGLARRSVDAEADVRPVLTRRPRPSRIPLSHAQQRYWLLNQFDTDSAVDNISFAVRLSGDLDVTVLRSALTDVVQRHESLRTVYPVDGDGPHQVVLVTSPAVADLTPVTAADDEIDDLARAVALRGFDVAAEVPVDVRLFRTPHDYVVVFVVHHICADGSSTVPLIRDLATAFTARSNGTAPPWRPLTVQYADYALWQRELLGSDGDQESLVARQIAYWTTELAGLPDQLVLPSDRPRPPAQSFRGATVRLTLTPTVHRALLELALGNGATLFMVMRTALAVLLSRLSGTSDIAIGTPVAGRGEAALDDLIGMFVNTLVLRTRVDLDASFTELLTRTRETDLRAFAHSDVPFERLVEALNPVRSVAHNPLFQVGFAFQNFSTADLELPGLGLRALEIDTRLAKTDLHIQVLDQREANGVPGPILIEFGYTTDLFDEGTVQQFIDRYARILRSVLDDPAISVGDISIVDDAEQVRLLSLSMGTDRRTPDETLVGLFDTQVAAAPDALAIVCGAVRLSYAQLDARVNRLARHLISLGVGPESVVALAIPRSIDLVVAMYAVAKAGGAYLPLDPDQPLERLQWVLDAARPVVELTATAMAAVDLSVHSAARVTDDDRLAPLRPGNTAYVLFTSGSTGRPKAVAITHGAIANQLLWKTAEFSLAPDDRVLVKTTATFDLSVWEYWCGPVSGGALVLASADGHREPAYLNDLIRTEGVTTLHVVPAMLDALLDACGGTLPDPLRRVLAIGEALPRATATRFRQNNSAHLFNLYGPTEAAVSATAYSVSDSRPGSVPIGTPVWNTQALVLDSRLHPVPHGVPGELYLAGAQLARGYHHRPELTADRFVANPMGPAGGRMYRTGDLVTQRASGELEYLGRNDFQIKLRGFRIEPGEIEAALATHPSVSRAVVVPHNDPLLGDRLVGYVVPAGRELDIEALRTTIAVVLPSYMVPSVFVVLDEIPMNTNGKVDRKALPEPVFQAHEFRAPSSPIEELVAHSFAEVLGVHRVGLDDDFFAIGGNSLVATQVAARLGVALDTQVPVRTLFEAPTVAELAARVARLAGAGGRPALTARPRPKRIPLSLAQQRMWFLNRFDPRSAAYHIPIAVRLSGQLDVSALRSAVVDVILRHEVLRTVYPTTEDGPVQEILPIEHAMPDTAVTTVPADELADRLYTLATTPFDVTSTVPVRVGLFELGPREHVLALVVHHIAADGSSVRPLTRDVMRAYTARGAAGEAPDWSPLPVQYADYALWQRAAVGSENDADSLAAQQISYWRAALADLPGQLDLPSDRPRPAVQSLAADTVHWQIDADTHQALISLARQHGATLFMVLHSAFAVLLARMSCTGDIVIGVPVAGRADRALDDLIGMFVNTLVLRSRIDESEPFTALLARQRDTDVQAYANADIPFERLVEILDPPRSTARHPLFQVGLAFQNMARTELELPGLTVAGMAVDIATSQFDLDLTVADGYADDGTPTGIGGVLTYATDLFDASTAQEFANRLVRILSAVVANPLLAVGDIELLDEVERSRVLVEWNDTDHPIVARASVMSAFEERVVLDPDAPAVVFGQECLTYMQLDARANRLARWLIGQGVGPNALVVSAMRRSLDQVIAMYAIAKAGGTYVPLDPDQPDERLRHVLDSAAPHCVLTSTPDEFTLAPATTVDTLDLSTLSAAPIADDERVCPLRPEHAAYVIYTSGSTGLPKGVAVSHAALGNQLAWMRAEYRVDAADVYLQKTAATFDVSLWGYFLPLQTGARLILAAPDGHRDPRYLSRMILEHQVSITDFVPSLLAVFAAHAPARALASLRAVLVIGEALPPETVRAFHAVAAAEVHNLYGPTEAAVSITHRQVSATDTAVLIGTPEWNSQVFVLDSRLRPVPAGVTGELYLAGAQLADGYHRRPDLTADRFVANPLGAPGTRMYRTGDLVRWTRAGALDYLGRVDFQVKVRGQRIELGEIETALLADPTVAQAVATVTTGATGDQLVGYVVPAGGAHVDAAELRESLTRVLPSYMVPSTVLVLDTFPVNTSGKLDRSALPQPVFRPRDFLAPSTPIEHLIANAFTEVLGVPLVGVEDSFFELGGTSLLAFTLHQALAARLDRELPMSALFGAPTVRGLAARVAGQDVPVHSPAMIAADAVLGLEIGIADLAPVHAGPARDVLLTGATGFVGAYLLRELVDRTEAQVWCLVRADSVRQGRDRIRSALQAYRLWDDTLEARVVPVPGDLAEPSFGLADADFARLAARVDAIYHNGARVNHVEPYPLLRATNVEGTREVLRLATTQRIKPVHFVSTADTVVPATVVSGSVLREATRIDADELPAHGYVASKWAAEQLILQAAERGVPARVYRPGLVSGDFQLGVNNVDDAFWNMIRAAAILGIAPDVGDATIALVPVSYVAAAIVAISTEPVADIVYHLVNEKPVALRDILECLRRRGLPVASETLDTVQLRLADEARTRNAAGDDSLVRAVLLSGNYAGGTTDIVLDDTNTRKALGQNGIRCPAIDETVLDIYIGSFIASGFLPEPNGAPRAESGTATSTRQDG